MNPADAAPPERMDHHEKMRLRTAAHLATRPAVGYADAQGRPVGGQIKLTPIGGDAGCPVGECGHPGPSHEADEYTPDGAPLRPICCAGDCRCGDQWRNT